jgi:hypothetical protein
LEFTLEPPWLLAKADDSYEPRSEESAHRILLTDTQLHPRGTTHAERVTHRSRLVQILRSRRMYYTLMMSTGLTFGNIAVSRLF